MIPENAYDDSDYKGEKDLRFEAKLERHEKMRGMEM